MNSRNHYYRSGIRTRFLKLGGSLILVFLLAFFQGCKQQGSNQPVSNNKLSTEPLPSFIRLEKNASGVPIALEIASARYVSDDSRDIRVDLIGAVHFGEDYYYDQLNEQFQQYDALLYELVGPKNSQPSPQGHFSSIGRVQLMLADLLTLEHQLVGINYQAQNFVHADSSFEDLQALAEERGDTLATILAGLLQDILRSAAKLEKENKGKLKSETMSFTAALDIATDPVKVKQLVAESLVTGSHGDMLGQFPSLSPYLLESRNDQALNVLKQQIDKGHTKLGVFYGAAHLHDFENKLFKDFGLKRSQVDWRQAWDLTKSHRPQRNETVQLIRTISNLVRLAGG